MLLDFGGAHVLSELGDRIRLPLPEARRVIAASEQLVLFECVFLADEQDSNLGNFIFMEL